MRNCYKIALPKISSMPKDKGIMVTGSPGIGKSRFALPLITGLAQQGQRVSLTFTDDKVGDGLVKQFVYWDFGKDPIEVDYDNAQLAYGARHTLAYTEREVFRIFDGEPPKSWDGRGRIIVLTSPKKVAEEKFERRGSVDKLYFSVWRLPALERVRQQFYSDRMEFADLLERLAMLGPIPRDIFEADKWDLEKLEREYRGLNLEFAAALNMISPRSNYSGTLVHLLADRNLQLKGYRFASPAVTALVSKWFWEYKRKAVETLIASARQPDLAGFLGLMFEHLGHKMFLEQCVTLKLRRLSPSANRKAKRAFGADLTRRRKRPNMATAAAAAAPPPLLQDQYNSSEPTVADVVEPDSDTNASVDEGHHAAADRERCWPAAAVSEDHQQWQRGTRSKPVSRVSKMLKKLQLSFSSVVSSVNGATTVRKLGPATLQYDYPGLQLNSLAAGTYLQPTTPTNAAWDAVYFDSAAVYILQYTVSSKHGAKAQPLNELLQRLGRDLASRAQLVFVVPIYAAGQDDLVATYPAQPYTGVRDSALERVPAAVQQLPQYVAGLSVVSTISPPSSSSGSPNTSEGGAGAPQQGKL